MGRFQSPLISRNGCLYSPLNYAISIFLFIFRIYTFFGKKRTNSCASYTIFGVLKYDFFYTLILKFQLEPQVNWVKNCIIADVIIGVVVSPFQILCFFWLFFTQGLNSPNSVHLKVILISICLAV